MAIMSQQLLQSRTEGEVLVLTMTRPETRNALNADLADAIAAAVNAPPAGVGAVVLTGAGAAFCAGGDLDYLMTSIAAGPQAVAGSIYRHFQGLILALVDAPLPVVAAINGPALGAGLDLALACDLRVAAPGATLSSAWIKLGLATGMGGSWLLHNAVGAARAAELLLLGGVVDALQARDMGLVTRVAENDVVETAIAMAAELARRPRAGMWQTRQSLRRARGPGFEEELKRLGEAQAELLCGADFALLAGKFLARS